ncbi:MAG: ABC transporter ATP-binding protein [Filimonas sp.]|nr:ABC transporter ATP-binding protein [Filimonas sp.]
MSTKKISFTTFRAVCKILLPAERRQLFYLLLLSTAISLIDILSIAFLFFSIHFYTSKNAVSFLHIPIGNATMLPAIFLLLLFAIKSYGGYITGKYQYNFVHAVSARLSEKALILHLEGSYQDHISGDTGTLIRRIVYTPTEFAQFILLGYQQLITESILVLLATITLLLYNAFLFAAIAVVLLPAIFLLSYFIRKRLNMLRQNIQTSNEQSLRHLTEALDGYIESNLHNKNTFFSTRYGAMQREVNKHIAALQITQVLPSRFFELFAIAGLSLLMMITLLTGQQLSMLTLGAFVAAAYKIIPNISRIMNIRAQLHTYNYTVKDLLKNLSSLTSNDKKEPENHLSTISFDQISFSYNDNTIISNLSFDLTNGSFIGISGDSGIGKTTVLNLLLGFLTPKGGDIFINNKYASPTERKNNWPHISYVQQSPFLAQDSILNNIILFEKEYDSARLSRVLDVTGVHTIATSLPDGIHTILREGGRNLSGGQRQRIAIARALYKKADLFLLDEPFNELDETTEARLLAHFNQLAAEGKKIVLITHNKNSFRYCSKIIDLHAS